MNTALKKKSLEESLNGHTGGTIESERLVEVVGENELRDILDQYKEFLDKNLIFNYQGSAFDAEDVSYAFDLVKRTLTPEEINNFLQLTAICDDHPLYWSNTSLFLSGLIQESYNDGNSSFDLNFGIIPKIFSTTSRIETFRSILATFRSFSKLKYSSGLSNISF